MNVISVIFPKKLKSSRHFLLLSAAVSLLSLAACASTPPPNEALQAAELAISTAEQARVADYASPELVEARQKLSAARDAVHEEKMQDAQRLAEQSRLDAELATAKTAVFKAKTVNEDMQKNTETLKQEMQRNINIDQQQMPSMQPMKSTTGAQQ
jgi:hypothetical protein